MTTANRRNVVITEDELIQIRNICKEMVSIAEEDDYYATTWASIADTLLDTLPKPDSEMEMEQW